VTCGLIKPDGRQIATFQTKNTTAEVWFDRQPSDDSTQDQHVQCNYMGRRTSGGKSYAALYKQLVAAVLSAI
jgi:hypothetical protein